MKAINLSFDNKEVAILQICALFDNAQRHVSIYTPTIDFSFWGETDVLHATKKFLLSHSYSQLELIQIQSDFSRNSPWVQLAKRLSHIEVLQISQQEADKLEPEACFAFADQQGVFIQNKQAIYRGYCSSFNARQNQLIQQRYANVRQSARPCLHFKTLMV